MKKNGLFVAMLAMILTLGLVLAGCDNGSTDNGGSNNGGNNTGGGDTNNGNNGASTLLVGTTWKWVIDSYETWTITFFTESSGIELMSKGSTTERFPFTYTYSNSVITLFDDEYYTRGIIAGDRMTFTYEDGSTAVYIRQ